MASTRGDENEPDYVVGEELPRLAKADFLRLIPVRLPELDLKMTDRDATITLHMKKRGLFSPARTKRVVFDKVGSLVLRCSDGTKTVEEISMLLSQTFGINLEQAEASLIQFLTNLHARGFIQLRKPIGWAQQSALTSAPTPAPEAQAERCPQCGAALPEGAFFCAQCGAKVT
ncbi:MAG: PqqD family peptide modification chaperone [Candidatus Bathyarchaeia archaeon]